MIHLISATEVISSLFLYGIVHGFIYLGRRSGHMLTQLVASERGQIVHAHSRERHDETLKNCTEGRCSELISTIVAETA